MKPEQIDELDFLGNKVQVFFDQTQKDSIQICWRARNPDSFYQGIVYLGENGISYPEGAVIPEQTEEDKEIIPRFIILGTREITQNLRNNIFAYLESDHKKRNGFNG